MGTLVTDDLVIVLIKTADTRRSGGACVIGRRGQKRVTMTRTGGAWTRPETVIVWDDTDTTTRVVSDLPNTSPTERTAWENLCYRPGTPANPRDSYTRELQGY